MEGISWEEGNGDCISMTAKASLFYLVYPGSEKLDLGPKRWVAICKYEAHADLLIKRFWPDFGYWEKITLHGIQECGLYI